ncbi:hypothetical protein CRG98_041835 [Punica granatum]|uniref:Uncharacterized protein n=1 Tax=Punica granatum TaxID=22663 RepID=A0A2I0I1B9_PUNGR|nr:hypothetical protein CRG98_041835 [Punica granatum]
MKPPIHLAQKVTTKINASIYLVLPSEISSMVFLTLLALTLMQLVKSATNSPSSPPPDHHTNPPLALQDTPPPTNKRKMDPTDLSISLEDMLNAHLSMASKAMC